MAINLAPELAAQKHFQESATNAMTKNPQMRRLIQRLCQLFGVDYNTLSEMEQVALHSIAMTLANHPEWGPKLGLDNGATAFEAIHSGITANAIPIISSGGLSPAVLDGGVGSGRSPYLGRSYGTGFNSTAIASQIQAQFNKNVYQADGSVNTAYTKGLSTQLVAEVYGELAAKRDWKKGDVVMADFGQSYADMEKEVNRLLKSGVVQKDSSAHEHLNTMLRYRHDADEVQRELSDKLGRQASFDEVITEMSQRKDSKGQRRWSNDRILKDIQVQSRNALRGTIVDDRVLTTIGEDAEKYTENLRSLQELSGHMDLKSLQRVADELRMGSLTDEQNIKSVRDRILSWKVSAAITGKQVQEVMKMEQDLVKSLAPTYGGAENVPASEVQAVRSAIELGQKAFESGDSIISGEQMGERRARTGATTLEHYSGVLIAETLQKDGDVTEAQNEAITKLRAEWEDAAKRGDKAGMEAISNKLYELSAEINPNAISEDYHRYALRKADTGKVMQSAFRSSAQHNIEGHVGDLIRAQKDTPGSHYSVLRTFAGEDENLTAYKKALTADVMFAGGDTELRNELHEAMVKYRKGDTADFESMYANSGAEGKKQLDALRQYAASAGSAEELELALKKGKTTINNDTNLASVVGVGQEDVAARMEISEIHKNITARESGIREQGINNFVNGLLKTGGFSDEEVAQVILSKHKGEITNKDGSVNPERVQEVFNKYGIKGTTVGELAGDGTLKDPESVLNNAYVREKLGIKSDEEAVALATQMKEDPKAQAKVMKDLLNSGALTTMNGTMFLTETGSGKQFSEAYKKSYETHRGAELMSIFGEAGVAWNYDEKTKKYTPAIKYKQADGTAREDTNIYSAMEGAYNTGTEEQRAALAQAANNGNKNAKLILSKKRSDLGQTTLNYIKENDLLEGSKWDTGGEIKNNEAFRDVWNRVQAGDETAIAELLQETGTRENFSSIDAARAAGFIENGKWTIGHLKGEEVKSGAEGEEQLAAMRKDREDFWKVADATAAGTTEQEANKMIDRILGKLTEITNGTAVLHVQTK